MVVKYWKELIFFGVITVIYVVGVSPDMTWMSLGGDQPDYVAAASSFGQAGLMGYPSYIVVGWFFERLPFNSFWNLGLLSALSSVVTCIVIYLTVKLFTSNKLAPFIGAATYAGAFIVWSQSVIPEVYTFTSLLMVVGTYFILRRKYWLACGIFAFSLGAHPIVVFAIIPCLIYIYFKEDRNLKLVSKLCGFGSLGLLMYLLRYLIPSIAGSNPLHIDPITLIQWASGGFFRLPVVPIEPLLLRGWEVITVVLASVGFALPLLFLLRRSKEVYLLSAIALLSLAFYAMSFYPQWITYLVFPVAFMSILVGIGTASFPFKKYLPIFLVIPLFLLGFNLWNYDIGRSVDPETTTARQFYTELEALPSSSLLVTHSWGHPWVLAYYYCSEEEASGLDILNIDVMATIDKYPNHLSYLNSRGVKLPSYIGEEVGLSLLSFIKDVQELNPDREVYVAYLKERSSPMEFGIIPASSYYARLNDLPYSKNYTVRD